MAIDANDKLRGTASRYFNEHWNPAEKSIIEAAELEQQAREAE